MDSKDPLLNMLKNVLELVLIETVSDQFIAKTDGH
jgi:hypothetical protein